MEFNPEDHSHKRYNILTGEWVLVSPHRSKRPWQGQVEKEEEQKRPSYDSNCYLCPGNERISGDTNPSYPEVFVFQNDFGALQEEAPEGATNIDDLLISESEKGLCRVICFSPDHSLTLPLLPTSKIRKVIDVWQEQFEEIGAKEGINYVQIFENKGSMMGCSNPHPHGQIWANSSIPNEPAKEQENMSAYFEKNGKTILENYLKIELEKKERIVVENDTFVALVPFWATWPFETILLPKRAAKDLTELTDQEKNDFADALKQLTIRYDNLFEASCPYSSGIHQRPTDGNEHPEWHMHMHFYPPLLRSATVKKFMVGYEMLGTPQRDITPEFAAKRLKEVSDSHYSK